MFFARTLPGAVNTRPTIAAIAKDDTVVSASTGCRRNPLEIARACEANQKRYAEAVAKDPLNEVFGPPETYCSIYSLEQLRVFKAEPLPVGEHSPYDNDVWMRKAAHALDIETLQEPVVLVHEYGLNMRMAGELLRQKLDALVSRGEALLHFGQSVVGAEPFSEGIDVRLSSGESVKAEHLFNCAGVDAGALDDALGIVQPRYADIKVAGVFKLPEGLGFEQMPCVYVLGNPMTQFSPCDPEGRTAVVTATRPDATYIPQGPVFSGMLQSAPDIEAVGVRRFLDPLPETESEARLKAMRGYWTARMPGFAHAEGVALLGGSVDIMGSCPKARTCDPAYHSDARVTCLSSAKAAATARAAYHAAQKLRTAKSTDTDTPLSAPTPIARTLSMEDTHTNAQRRALLQGLPGHTAAAWSYPSMLG